MSHFTYFASAKQNSASHAISTKSKNEIAKSKFQSGEYSIHKFYKEFMFELSPSRIDFLTITNTRGGNVEHGKLIKLNGNFNFISDITYYGDSLTKVYKTRYFIEEGSIYCYHANEWYMNTFILNGEKIDWKKAIDLMYDVEGIRMAIGTSKEKRMKAALIAVMGYRFPTNLIQKAIDYIFN